MLFRSSIKERLMRIRSSVKERLMRILGVRGKGPFPPSKAIIPIDYWGILTRCLKRVTDARPIEL